MNGDNSVVGGESAVKSDKYEFCVEPGLKSGLEVRELVTPISRKSNPVWMLIRCKVRVLWIYLWGTYRSIFIESAKGWIRVVWCGSLVATFLSFAVYGNVKRTDLDEVNQKQENRSVTCARVTSEREVAGRWPGPLPLEMPTKTRRGHPVNYSICNVDMVG